jgi:hypothetical protein
VRHCGSHLLLGHLDCRSGRVRECHALHGCADLDPALGVRANRLHLQHLVGEAGGGSILGARLVQVSAGGEEASVAEVQLGAGDRGSVVGLLERLCENLPCPRVFA